MNTLPANTPRPGPRAAPGWLLAPERSGARLSAVLIRTGASVLLLLHSASADAQAPGPGGQSNSGPIAAIRQYSSQTVVLLDPAEAFTFRLKNGTEKVLRLLSVTESKDSVIGLIRRAEARVEVDGRPLELVCAPYVMPTEFQGIRIQADTTSAWLDLPKRAQFSLWDGADPIVDTRRFRFPLPEYELFSHGSQAYGEPVHLGAGDGDPKGQRFYHDYGFDMAGYEGREEVVSVVEGRVVKFWPSREDPCSVLVEDQGGLVWEHAHLKALAPGLALNARVALGQKIGILGRTGPSGNFSHLHVGNFLTRRDSEAGRANRRLNLYPWIVAAYQAQRPQGLLAVARPHQLALTGERILLDGGNSLAWGGRRILEWRWVLPDGRTVKRPRVETAFDSPGAHVAALWVKDDQGAEDVDFCQIKVFSRGQPQQAMPHLFMTHSPAREVRPGQEIGLRLWFQGEGGGPIEVEFGDNSGPADCASYQEIRHRYQAPGLYVITAQSAAAGLPVVQKQKVVVRTGAPSSSPPAR